MTVTWDSVVDQAGAWRPPEGRPQVNALLHSAGPPTPFLVVDLAVVADRFKLLRAALPQAHIYYAVKANPAPEVVRLLARLGCGFDVASRSELDLCLAHRVTPERISYGNTIKKSADIAYAYARGVRTFAFDSEQELRKIAANAPGASVHCRVLVASSGARWPLGRKFGCTVDMAADLLISAPALGLDPHGVCFHVGSQQLDPGRWQVGIEAAARVFHRVGQAGIVLRSVNLGGGFPARYREPTPGLGRYAGAIQDALHRHFGQHLPAVWLEPGRSIVGDAGVLHAEVVLVARKAYDERNRWVYLDVGRFGGLAETEGEAIAYPIGTPHDGTPDGPVILAGPTCDSVDILYEHAGYRLPLALTSGDRIWIRTAGAYTASYSSVGFNGFGPLPMYCIGDPL
jgi:ornithine decarboxylase